MTDNSVSFGSTTFFYKGNNTPIHRHISKLLKSGEFSEVKRVDSLALNQNKLKHGQIGLFHDTQGVTLIGQNAKEDKLIYDILTNNGKRRLPGSSYVTDILNLVV